VLKTVRVHSESKYVQYSIVVHVYILTVITVL